MRHRTRRADLVAAQIKHRARTVRVLRDIAAAGASLLDLLPSEARADTHRTIATALRRAEALEAQPAPAGPSGARRTRRLGQARDGAC